jgi:DNA-binding beta-propeller fold protein YncE
MWKSLSIIGLLGILLACSSAKANPGNIQPTPVPLPGSSGGIGFDDLGYDAQLGVVLVPAGRTGNLDLIDPKTLTITTISGFSAQNGFGGGHGDGTTSVDAGRGLLFATDRNKMQVDVVDPATKTILSSAPVDSDPDYIRYVDLTGELWITEPDKEQIEVFSLFQDKTPVHSVFITVRGGPESLVIDKTQGRAYTHLWAGATVEIDLKTHSILTQFPNGCRDSRGIALDEKAGFLFAGCAEGKTVVLDVTANGRQLSSLNFGAGVDVISYNPTLKHLYVPGASSATMGILAVSDDGKLSLVATADTASGAHCVTADDLGNAWVCDPDHGQLLLIKDPSQAIATLASTSDR